MTHPRSAPTPVGPEHPVKLISLAVHNASANHWGRPWRRRTLSVLYPRELTFKGIRLPTQQVHSWLHLLARSGMLNRRRAVPAVSPQSETANQAPLPVETPQASSALADLAFEWSSEMIPDFAQFARLSRLKREQEQASIVGSEDMSDSTGDQERFDGLPSDADAVLSQVSMDAVSSDVLDAEFLDPVSSSDTADEESSETTQHAEGTAVEPIEQHGSGGTVTDELQAVESPAVTGHETAPVSGSVPMYSTVASVSAASAAAEGVERIVADASEQPVREESILIEPDRPFLPEREVDAEPIGTPPESAEAEPVPSTSVLTAPPDRQNTEISPGIFSDEVVVHASLAQTLPDAPDILEPLESPHTKAFAHHESTVDERSLEWQSNDVTGGADLDEPIDDAPLAPELAVQVPIESSELSAVDATGADVPDEPEQQALVEQEIVQVEKFPEPDGAKVADLQEGAVAVEPLSTPMVEPAASPESAVAAGVGAMDLQSLDEAVSTVRVAAEALGHFEPEEDTLTEAVLPQENRTSAGQSDHLMVQPAMDEQSSHGVSGCGPAQSDVALEPIIASLEDALAMLEAASTNHDGKHSLPCGCNDEESSGSEFLVTTSIDVAAATTSQSSVAPAVPAVEPQPLADNHLEAAVLQGVFIQKETEMTHVHDELPEADVRETAVPVTSVELQEVSAVLNVPQLEADPEDVLSDVQSTLNSLAGMAQGLTQQKQAAGRLQEELEEWSTQLQERERLVGDKEERLLQLENHLKEAKANLDRMAAENNRLLAERSEALKELAQTVDMRDKATLKRAESIQLEQQRIDEHSASLRGRASELDELESALKRKTEELAVRLKQLQSAKDKFSTIVKSFNETVQFNSTLSAISKTVSE